MRTRASTGYRRGFLRPGIGEGVPLLQAVDSQHRRERERPPSVLRTELGMVRRDHGFEHHSRKMVAISAKNTSRFVRFFFAAQSSDEKLNWSTIEAPTSVP